MNKSGQSMIFGIMLMVFTLITVVIMTQPIMEFIDLARDADHLNCSSNDLGTGTIATCLIFDIYLPYFVAAALFIGGGAVVVKKFQTV